jgi:hypothetical protein
MLKIVQVLSLLSWVCSAFAVSANLYSVIDCPSNIYIMGICTDLPEYTCCTDHLGVRSICSYHSHLSDIPLATTVLYLERDTLWVRGQLLCPGGPMTTTVAPDALQTNRQPAQSVSRRLR